MVHANPYDCLHWIKRINENIWNLANNHAMDCGEEGLLSTLDAAQSNGFQTIGIGQDVDAAGATAYGIPCLDSLGTRGGGSHTIHEFAYLESLAEAAKRVAAIAYGI